MDLLQELVSTSTILCCFGETYVLPAKLWALRVRELYVYSDVYDSHFQHVYSDVDYDSHSTLLLVSTIQFPSWAIDPLITDQTLCAANAECSVLDMLTPDKCPEQIPIVSNVVLMTRLLWRTTLPMVRK